MGQPVTKSLGYGQVVWWGTARRGSASLTPDDRTPVSAPLCFDGWCLLQTARLRSALDAHVAAAARRDLITVARAARADRAHAALAAVGGARSRSYFASAVARRGSPSAH